MALLISTLSHRRGVADAERFMASTHLYGTDDFGS
jgi:hypothetical protein